MSKESLIRSHRHKQIANTTEWLANGKADVLITSVCAQQCALCCYRDIVHSPDARHFPVDEILDAVKRLHRVGLVCISGGEPTQHPEIEYILKRSREIRGSSLLELMTNGMNLVRLAPVTKYVDSIQLSVFYGDPVRMQAAEEYRKIKPANVELRINSITPHDRGGGPFPCQYLPDTLSVRHGRIYPCCGGAGVADAQSTELTGGWEKRLLSLEAPCERCVNGRY